MSLRLRKRSDHEMNAARKTSPKILRTILLIALIAVTITVMAAFAACAQEQPKVATTGQVAITGQDGRDLIVVNVEVAATNAKRELGLMFRRHLDEAAGMIFLFKQPQHLTFWMKNTLIPLDMIFADSDGRIVGIVENAAPLSESIDAVDGDSQYVLEVNGGFSKRHGVIAGDRLRFIGFVPNASD
jgi:uncharacterized membrane protein (UPF0127 family)